MAYVYLLLGRNVGDRFGHIQNARTLIAEKAGEILKASQLYETAAWGITDQENFLNQALLLQTNLQPTELLTVLQEIEKLTGRVNTHRWGPRIIDIDILFWEEQTVNEPHLTIPHPQVQYRRFALAPLLDLAPDYMHPVLHLTVKQMLAQCPDKLPVRAINEAYET